MELTLLIITFLWSVKKSSSIQCHICDAEYSYNRLVPICDHFTYGDERYVTDCPKSTMCFKKLTTLDIGNGLVSEGVERGCASQTTDGEQRKVNRGWEDLHTVYEPYEEGCTDDPRNAERPTKTLFCYCRGDLCNRVGRMSSALTIIAVSIGLILGIS